MNDFDITFNDVRYYKSFNAFSKLFLGLYKNHANAFRIKIPFLINLIRF